MAARLSVATTLVKALGWSLLSAIAVSFGGFFGHRMGATMYPHGTRNAVEHHDRSSFRSQADLGSRRAHAAPATALVAVTARSSAESDHRQPLAERRAGSWSSPSSEQLPHASVDIGERGSGEGE